jgi:glycosyltransferase involved in cell wall biosynthesis
MRIAQLVSNAYPVKSHATQAIYSHVSALTDTFATAGHDVHLFAAENSETKGILHSVPDGLVEAKVLPADIQRHWISALISDCYKQADNFDIIHSHFSLLSSFYAQLSPTPTLLSVHSPIREEIKPILLRYLDLPYVSFSHAQRKQVPELNWVANIYHGIDTNLFGFSSFPKDYFLYLGRVTEEKGVHFAIEAAKAAGVPLVIAGRSYSAEGYWQEKIEPEINGHTVRYVGEAGLDQKIELLRGAKALLFPTQYDETFGLVMIEAMSCGTPIIAWRNGSVPEVVQDKETGYIVDSVKDMVKAIGSIEKISRAATRSRAQAFFSKEKMTQGYLKVYERIIEKNLRKKKVPAKPKTVTRKK